MKKLKFCISRENGEDKSTFLRRLPSSVSIICENFKKFEQLLTSYRQKHMGIKINRNKY